MENAALGARGKAKMNKRGSDLTDINLVALNKRKFMIAHSNFQNRR